MEYSEFQQLLSKSISQNDLPMPEEYQMAQFWRFTEHLMKVNAVTNLTAIRSINDAVPKHLVDSLFAAEYLPEGARVLDLGCGPGFPSLPLAIMRPDLEIVALDSTAKKIAFINETISLLSLKNMTAVAGRAEDRTLMTQLGEFDVVVSRAVARLHILTELCLPYVAVGGFLLALKAAKGAEEAEEAKKGVALLGGGKQRLFERSLTMPDGGEESRCLILIPKIKKTPSTYPRSYASILKKPL